MRNPICIWISHIAFSNKIQKYILNIFNFTFYFRFLSFLFSNSLVYKRH